MLCRLNFDYKAAMWLISHNRPVVRFRDYWVDSSRERGQLALNVLKEFSNLSVLEVQGLFFAMDQSVEGGAPPPPGGGAPTPPPPPVPSDQGPGVPPPQALPRKTRWTKSPTNKVITAV